MTPKTGCLLTLGLWVALFAISGSALNSEEAAIASKEILKSLVDIRDDMNNNKYQQVDRAEWEKKLRDVNALIDIAAVNKAKCSPGFFESVDSRLTGELANKFNLKIFLKHNRQEQLKLCKIVLNESVKQLSEEEAQRLLELKNEIIHSKKDALQLIMPTDKVAGGLVSYLQLNANLHNFGDSATMGQEIGTKLNQYIGGGCTKLLDGTGQMGDLNMFLTSEDSVRELDTYTLDWVATRRVCHFIANNFDSVLDGALNATLDTAQGFEKPTDRCGQLYEQLITTTAARSAVRPEQVIEFLNNIIQVCGSCSDEGSLERARAGLLLKELYNVQPAKCTQEQLEEFDKYEKQVRQGTVLKGYLLDSRDELIKLCTEPVAAMASRLDKQVLRDMTSITANIARGVALRPDLLRISPVEVKFGLGRLITGLKSVVPEEQLAAEFSTKLNNACQATTIILGQLKDFYLSLAKYSELHLGETLQTWLTHYQVCNSITPIMVSNAVMYAYNAGSKVYEAYARRLTNQNRTKCYCNDH